MTYDQRMREERKRLTEGVDDFLRERMRPDCPTKIAARAQSKAVLRQYYDRKALNK